MKKFTLNKLFIYLFTIASSIILQINLFATPPDIKIVGGSPANIEDYPYQVALYSIDEEGNLNEFTCGGSIIDRYWILTAAHCVVESAHKKQKIVAAFSKLSEIEQATVYEISDYIIHPQFNMQTVENDIALLRLAYPIDTSNAASKVIRLLTPAEEQQGLIDPGTMATITGWGTTQYMGDQPDQLQVGFLPIISVETANQWFAESAPGSNQVLESMLPAGFEEGGVSGCHGDSGGPLTVKDATNTSVLAGITSWGNVCGAPKQPAVYTRVPYFYSWIMNNSKINTPTEPIYDDFVELHKLYIKDKVYSCGGMNEIGEFLVVNTGKNVLEKFDVEIKIGSDPSNITKTITRTINIEQPLLTGGSKRIPIILEESLENYGMYYIEVHISKPNGVNVQLDKFTENKYFELARPDNLTLNIQFGNIFQAGWTIINAYTGEQVYRKEYNMTSSGKKIDEDICLGEGHYMFYFVGMGTYDFNLAIEHNDTIYNLLWNEEQSFMNFTSFTIPFEPIYDVSLVQGSDLVDNKIKVCDLNEVSDYLDISLINSGTLPAKNLAYKITYEYNMGNNTETYTFIDTLRGTLFAAVQSPLIFEANRLRIGKNKIKIEVLSYDNSDQEIELDDNMLELEFDVEILPKFATIKITPDENYMFYGWSILNQDGEILISKNFESPNQVELDLCLPEGCYYFVPRGFMNQPLSVDTAVVIKDIYGNILLVVKGSEFLNENSFEFCNTISSVKDAINVEELKLYPNPTSRKLNIEFSIFDVEKANISIVNALGHIVHRESVTTKLGNNQLSIDINKLPVGIYSLQLELNNRVLRQKFVVVR